MRKAKLQSQTKPTMMAPMQAAVALAHIQDKPKIHQGDALELDWIPDESVHLVLTSPPYWTLKRYREHERQMGHIVAYETFHNELDKVWKHCLKVLVPGGRSVCFVGDVC